MIERKAKNKVLESLRKNPAIAILGPRQVGKTTLAKSIITTIKDKTEYFDLEKESDFKRIKDSELVLSQLKDSLVVIDEIQNKPDLFPLMRALIDEHRIPGRFLLLGSSSPHLIKQSSQSLAGRISYIELTPVNILEIIERIDRKTHWLRGGFPNSLLAENDKDSFEWLDDLVKTYSERDFKALGLNVMPRIIRQFWEMLAHFHGGIWNASSFGRALGASYATVNKYLNFMEGAFLVRILQPFFINVKKRISKAPKVYIRDTGILHYLNNIADFEQLWGTVLIGASWEGYVVEQIAQYLPNNVGLYYYRTHHGSEIDLILTKGLRPATCIEIKFTVAPSLTKGNTIALQDIGTKNNFIIYYGSEEYKQRKDLTVCSLEIFLTKYLPEIIINE